MKNIAILLFVTLMAFAAYSQDGSHSISIVTPQDGTMVSPGDTINITVKTERSYMSVSLIGESPLPMSEVKSTMPFTFSFQIPQNIKPREYTVFAMGTIHPGDNQTSAPLHLKVEQTKPAAQIVVQPHHINFAFIGDSVQLRVAAQFNDSSDVNVTESSLIHFSSSDNTVATVRDGVAIATGPGTATVAVSYGSLQSSIEISVFKATLGDLNGDSIVDEDDLHILQSSLHGDVLTPDDARDLNHDGKIDEKDVEIMKQLIEEQNGKAKERKKER